MFNFKKLRRVYLDTAATTLVDSRVLKAMAPYFSEKYGNPSSIHKEGVEARKALEISRKQIADLIGAHADEIVFTSGGTEGDNLAILGVARGLLSKNKIKKPGHIITTAIEHQAVLESCKRLKEEGWDITYLPVSKEGIVDLVALKESLRPETVLVSIMYANNEIGTIEPLRDVAKILRQYRSLMSLRAERSNLEIASSESALPLNDIKIGGARLPYFHTDACQAPRFLSLAVEKLGIDLMTLNGGKMYGPKGIGCLYIKRNTFIEPIIYGGGQERGLRSGTENVALAVGLATALALAVEQRENEVARLEKIRDYFIKNLSAIPGVEINGGFTNRLANNISASFPGVLGEWLVLSLDAKGVAFSTGSACSSNHKDDAHVIIALGHDRKYAESTVRFTLDRATSKKDIDYVIQVLKEILAKNKNIVI